MKCKDVREELSAWLDEELEAAVRARVAVHLESCAACRRELAQLAALEAALANLAAPIPSGTAEKVLARLAPPPRHRWWQTLAVAASLVLGIALGGTMAQKFYPLGADNTTGGEMATLEAFHDFPQGSLGTILASYQADEGNGNGF